MAKGEKYEDDMHNVSTQRLVEILRYEIVAEDSAKNSMLTEFERTAINEAANRLEAREFAPYIPFNHEQFE